MGSLRLRSFHALALLTSLSALLGCAEERSERPSPNVLLITLDTLRADRLGCYGHERSTSPRIDALAARATLYANALATAPWTVPTHASLFTGRHPWEHGAITYETYEPSRNAHPLDPAHVTLAEVLREEGYATHAVVANSIYLESIFGLDQGFDGWDVRREYSPGVNARAFAWLEERARLGDGRPFLLFLNYLDTHRPYNVEPQPGEAPVPAELASPLLLDLLYEQVIVRGEEPGVLAERLIEQYERAVRNVDLAIGALLDRMVELDLYDDTLIVLTSDHGEYFGEHRLVEHSKDVYQEALRVPLVVKLPGQRKGGVVETPISLVDVPRLVLAQLSPGAEARRAALFPYAAGEHPLLAENHFSRPRDLMHPVVGPRFRRVRTAFFAGGWKLVHSSDGRHELYRPDEDPREARDLAAEEPETLLRLVERVEAITAVGRWVPGQGAPRTDSEAVLREMRKLGY